MQVHVIETPSLGDRTYVVTDGEVAAVVDPQRDVDRVDAMLEQLGVRLTDVLETHIHNDYVTGGLALARRHGATYHVNAADPVDYARNAVSDGDEIRVGRMTIEVVATPGHTPTHLSFVARAEGETPAAFTGGSLLYGSVGRPDLVSAAMTEELARAQHASAHRLAGLPDETAVLPTHGFGSFCSSGDVTGATHSTIGQEKQVNDALRLTDTDEFVDHLLAGLDAFPAYYAHMAPANLAGPGAPDLTAPEPVDPTELTRRIHAGEWVVDLRERRAFASHHLVGTINVELSDSASTYLGWILPWGTPLTLLADTAEEVAAMQRQLVRIGVDELAGAVDDGLPDQGDRATYAVTDFGGLAAAMDEGSPWVLDARRNLEWAGGHVDGAHHVPLHELLDRMDEVTTDEPVWVHCQGGYRASIAASLLARAGRDVVLVDDSFDNARTAGVDVVA